MQQKKKVLVPILNRAHYGRLRSVLKSIQSHESLELQIVVGISNAYGSFWEMIRYSKPYSWRIALAWYVRAKLIFLKSIFWPNALGHDFLVRNITKDGFTVNATVPLFLDGGSSETMANVVGLGIPKIVRIFTKLKPDVVFINADRFEMMAITIAAAYLNIPIAHNEGGDVTGTIDESIRHAITKFAHYHFTSTFKSRDRVIRMGENPEYVFAVGSPAIDVIQNISRTPNQDIIPGHDFEKPYLVVLLHSVATENHEQNKILVQSVVDAVDEIRMPTIFLGSNMDAGSNVIGEITRNWQATKDTSYVVFKKHLPPDDFYQILSSAACAVGNSSSFIREAAFFGTPVVLIGSRQSRRERGKNVVDVIIPEKRQIVETIQGQIQRGRYEPDYIFGEGRAGEKIATLLANLKVPPIQKNFYES
ncbi:MAG: UDP-N-acetylglucosamine 2-epimerase [Patescibacteria group bacterium]